MRPDARRAGIWWLLAVAEVMADVPNVKGVNMAKEEEDIERKEVNSHRKAVNRERMFANVERMFVDTERRSASIERRCREHRATV